MTKFQNILVQVDTRSKVHPVLDRAVRLAKDHGSALKILDVVPELTWSQRAASKQYLELHELLLEKKAAAVGELAAAAREQGIQAEGKVLSGKSSLQIINEVKQAHHDLVMKDAKGARSHRLGLMGTTVHRLMRFCPCAVWSFRPVPSGRRERVVAAVDAHPLDEAHAQLNRRILDAAFGLSPDTPHVVHAWSVYGEHLIKDYMKQSEFEALAQEEEQQTKQRLSELLQPYSLSAESPEVHLLRGPGEKEIAKFVNDEQFDVLVMGTVGRSGISGLLVGNTAEALLDRANCSILAVKPQG